VIELTPRTTLLYSGTLAGLYLPSPASCQRRMRSKSCMYHFAKLCTRSSESLSQSREDCDISSFDQTLGTIRPSKQVSSEWSTP
jgi:hypothetical protein